uniref:hypothetical protein n=1 Tax=Wohlfahrtiimonas populi TaxID=1940240 RepID=UPI0013011DAA
QEDLNPTLAQDDRELDRREQLQLSQDKTDEMNAVYENRLNDINLELESITHARQSAGYWDQSADILNKDMAAFNQLTAEKHEIYDVLDKSLQE